MRADTSDMAIHVDRMMREPMMRPTATAIVFLDLAGLPGWGSAPDPTDPDTSTILERHLGPVGEIRVVQGCTALAIFPDVTAAVRATMGLLGEASRTSGSATAGAHVTGTAHDEILPESAPSRAAALLAHLADANRLLVTSALLDAISPVRGSVWSFDPGPTAQLGGTPLATFSVRSR